MSRDLDLDLGSGHIVHGGASLVDLYLDAKFYTNQTNFLWTDGRTDIETGFITSTPSR